MDPLMPLTAAVVTKDLEPQKRLALTGAALVLNGPLALAPALVAVERARRVPPRPTGAGPVGPRLVTVPDVTGKPLDEARKILTNAGLESSVSENESDEKEKGLVLRQNPKPSATDPVDRGLTVHLNVGAGPSTPPGQDDHNRLETKIESLGQRITEQSEHLRDELRVQGEQLREQLRAQLQDLTKDLVKAIESQKGSKSS